MASKAGAAAEPARAEEPSSPPLFGSGLDPRAVANLWASSWREFNRSIWGGWGASAPQEAGGESRELVAKTASGSLERRGRLFMPDSAGPGAPLLVMLHGCMQDAESFARLTRMDAIAREQGFNVLYPEQDSSANPIHGWNWFEPSNQSRLGGEPEALAGLIEQAQEICRAKPKSTWLAGISAGGALASEFAQLYPELLGAVAAVAGPAPFSAHELGGALEGMANGADPKALADIRAKARRAGQRREPGQARSLPILIVQGKADKTVNPANGLMQERAALLLNDALDDGRVGDSIHTEQRASRAGGGEAKVWRDGRGRVVAVSVSPEGLGHAWSGGDPSEAFSQGGFDQSRLALDFFRAASSGDWSAFDAPKLADKLWARRGAKPAPEAPAQAAGRSARASGA